MVHDLPAEIKIDVMLSEGFILTELAAITDTLRIAHRIGAQPVFRVSLRSSYGCTVRSACGLLAETTQILARPDADYMIVVGNVDPSAPSLADKRISTHYRQRDIPVIMLSEAAMRYIADTGETQSVTTHWEHHDYLAERYGIYLDCIRIASGPRDITTSAGMQATTDCVLDLLARYLPADRVTHIADILLHQHIGGPSAPQLPASGAPPLRGDIIVDAALALMRQNVEYLLSAERIALELNVSRRSLERRFKAVMGMSPCRAYRQLRLHKARYLLHHTVASVNDIALACGFPGGMSVRYRELFGATPSQDRAKRSQWLLTKPVPAQ